MREIQCLWSLWRRPDRLQLPWPYPSNQFGRVQEILGLERQATRYRNIASYLTMPCDLLNLFPGVGAVIEKGIDHLADSAIDSRLKDKYQRFYLLDVLVVNQEEVEL